MIIVRMLMVSAVLAVPVTRTIADSNPPKSDSDIAVAQTKPIPVVSPAQPKIAQPATPVLASLMPPDLVISSVDISLMEKRVRITVRNMGGSRSPATTVRFSCIGEGPGDDCFTRPVLLAVGALDAGASTTTETGLYSFWKPGYATKDANKYYAVVDPNNLVAESNETNNLYRYEVPRSVSSLGSVPRK
jgi:hypothetical protein